MTIYYVDASSGSDANDGLTQGSAWQSVGRVPADQLLPGDEVLLKAGETYFGSLIIKSSGTQDQPITVSSYGVGDKPVITGAVELHDSTWTETSPGSHIWTTAAPGVPGEATPGLVLFDGVKGNPSATNQAHVDAPGDWFWSNDVLSVYSTTPPPTAFGSVTLQVLDTALEASDATYVTFDGIAVTQARNGIVIAGSYGVEVKNFETSFNTRHGVFVNDSAFSTVEDGSTHDNGVFGAGASTTRVGSGVLIRTDSNNNTIQNIDSYENSEDGVQIAKDAGDANTINHNQLHGNAEDGIDIKQGTSTITNNLMFDNAANGILIHMEGDFAYIANNEIHIQGGGSGNALVVGNHAHVVSEGNSYFGAAAFTIQLNTTIGNNSTFTHDLIVGGGSFSHIAVSVQGGQNNTFDDVTIVMPFPGEAFVVGGTAAGTHLTNSVVDGTGGALLHYSDAHGLVHDGNLYFRDDSTANWIRIDGTGGTRVYSQADIDSGAIFLAEGKDQHSHTGDPHFVDPATQDYRLNVGSPAIDDGWDIIVGGANGDTVDGLGGNDVITGLAGANSLSGSAGDDSLDGGTEADTLSGGLDNDTVGGGEGDDSLSGGDGDDVLEGGLGSDIVAGGTGRDLFVVAVESPAIDTIQDLEVNESIVVSGVTLDGAIGVGDGTNVAAHGVNVQSSGGNTLLFVNTDDTPAAELTIQLTGVVAASDLALIDGAIRRVGPAIVLTTGVDTIVGASPVLVKAALGTLNPTDSLAAGPGYDELHLTQAGSYDLAVPTVFSGFETVVLDTAGITLGLRTGAALTVQGSTGTDTVALNGALDTLALNGGDDQVTSTAAALGQGDVLDGGTGLDTLTLTGGGTFDLSALGGLAGIEQIVLTDASHLVNRDGTDIRVTGSSGDDTVDLSNGPDRLALGEGSDTVVTTSANFRWDDLDGGDGVGTDTLVLDSSGPFNISDLKSFTGFEVIQFSEASSAGKVLPHLLLPSNLSLTVLGSSGADRVSLVPGALILGTVSIDLGGGDDQLRVSAGANPLNQFEGGAGTGDAIRFFGGGTLDLNAFAKVSGFEVIDIDEPGTVIMRAGMAVQVLGSAGADTVVLGSGAENVDLGDGRDTADYSLSPAAVFIDLGLGTSSGGYAAGDHLFNIETVIGGIGYDRLTGSGGDNELDGNGGKDIIDGAGGNDTLSGGANIDTLHGGDGNDVISGGDDRDNIFGDNNDDKITGDAGNDFLDGGFGNDTLGGGDGADRLFGQDGADSLGGGAGGDTLDGGIGADTMAGGLGDDVFFVDNIGDQVVESNGEGADTVHSSIADYTMDDYVDTLILDAGAVSATGNDSLNYIIGNDAANVIDGAGNNDRLSGGIGTDTIHGGEGNDILRGEADADSLDGGNGKDTLIGGAGVDTMFGGAKQDIFEFDSATETGVGAGNRDIILDFNNVTEHDRIDLRGIDTDAVTAGDQGFTFLGSGPFTNVAGQLRAADQGLDTVVQGDMNGDGTADFEILLQNHAGQPLLGSDFLL